MFKSVSMPILAQLLETRRVAGIIFVIGMAQAAVTFAGYGGWSCPLQSNLGLPCPGCGISRGIVSLLTGHWQAALQAHIFSPFVLIALGMLGICSLLPQRIHNLAIRMIAGIEKRTGISLFIIIGMFAIWVFRIVTCVSTRMDYQLLTMNTIGR